MKTKLLTLALLGLTTCVACNGPIPSGYPTVVKFVPAVPTGPTLLDRVEALEERMEYAERRLTTLEAQRLADYADLTTALEVTRADVDQLTSLLNNATDSIGLVNNQIFLLDQRIADIVYSLSNIQSQVVMQQTEIAELQTHLYVEEVIDPCGDIPGRVDEVLLRMSNGQLVVFFTDNGGDRLSVLGPGSYQVTDGTFCRFNVNSAGEITYP
jgi:hypothetical protein